MHANPYAEALKRKNKALFIPFVVLGDPDKKQSLEIVTTLIENGADALELGFPFSDPPADGPVIQQADTRALQAGVRIDHCFEMLKAIRKLTDIPIGLLVYYNLVLQRGVAEFYRDCAESGVDSVLIADLPLEHSSEIVPIAKAQEIAPVFLVSEMTTEDRLKEIAEVAQGYLYMVSYLGVTGVENADVNKEMRKTVERIRKYSQLPLIVGFGINTAGQALSAISAGGDGVIVGSRIVKEALSIKKISAVSREFSEVLK